MGPLFHFLERWEFGRRRESPPTERSFLVTDAFVLVGAAVENAAGAGVSLEPCGAAYELATALHGTDAMSSSGVLGHLLHLRSDSLGPHARGSH